MGRAGKLTTLAASTAVAVALGWVVLRQRAAPDIGIVDSSSSVEMLLLESQVKPRGLGPFELRPALASLPRKPIDETTIFRMHTLGPFLQWDAQQYFRYRPNLDDVIAYWEYPGGAYHRRTNDEGYRDDHPTPRAGAGLLVLATGDSHTDGVCENAESWPTRLESALAAARPGTSVEVLNAGVQNYSFYQYLGSVERALPLQPDAVVTLCYGGNDFAEVLLLHAYFQHTVRPVRTSEYWDALRDAQGVHEPELSQILNEAHYFDRFPDQVDRAVEAAAAVCAEIQSTCRQNGIAWVFAYLPSAYCLPWKELAADRAQDLEQLGLTEAAIERVGVIADRVLAILRERDVPVVDLRDQLGEMARRGEKAPYWGEYHIDPRGQELVAEWLLAPVEAALAR